VNTQATAALSELRNAAEDRDVEKIRSSILVATKHGVAPAEIVSAQHILNFESGKALCADIDKVRNMVNGLAKSVDLTKARVAAAESEGEWVSGLMQQIEERVWKSLEEKVEERIQAAVKDAAKELLSRSTPGGELSISSPQEKEAALRIQTAQRGKLDRQEIAKMTASTSKLQAAWRRKIARSTLDADQRCLAATVNLARKKHEAICRLFDECCIEGSASKGLDATGFHKAMLAAHPQLSIGQTSILFKGYTSGTGLDLYDLAGFCGTVEAVALGDSAAAEYADVNVETFQSMGASGAEKAALKIQAVQRGKAARAEVAEKKGEMEAAGGAYGAKGVEAATKIQRWIRKRGQQAGGMAATARGLHRRHKAWCKNFSEFTGNSDGGLDEEKFLLAVQNTLPGRAAAAQLQALYKGYLEGTGGSDVDMVGFVGICTAISEGVEVAAEFADLNVDAYKKLGGGS